MTRLRRGLRRLRSTFTVYYYPASGTMHPGVAVHFDPTKLGYTGRFFRRLYERQRLGDSALFM